MRKKSIFALQLVMRITSRNAKSYVLNVFNNGSMNVTRPHTLTHVRGTQYEYVLSGREQRARERYASSHVHALGEQWRATRVLLRSVHIRTMLERKC